MLAIRTEHRCSDELKKKVANNKTNLSTYGTITVHLYILDEQCITVKKRVSI